MKCILYGNGEAEPISEACTLLTKEFFRENTNTLRLIIMCLPYLDLEVYVKKFISTVFCIQQCLMDNGIAYMWSHLS
jgi:hypothetical protein